ncbi:MAG: Gfo/Idh/MocA family oxidoreductase [bacterium]|nr:Gfo/Idh/MocA family oxidoreductase [bacterium]
MEPIRVGVVGIGSMGINHARVYSELPQTELVGVVDVDEERAKSCAERYHTQGFTSYESLFDKVQAVNIVSPTAWHFSLAMEFLRRGIHVLVEKPITVDLDQAKRLVAYAKRKNLVLQVGHLERFNPAVMKLKQIIGTPVLVECHRLSGPTSRNLDVGIIWDLMIHDFDILLNLFKSPVVEISAMGTSIYSDFEDIAQVQLRFECGAIASLVASRNSGERKRRLKITEETGRVLALDFIDQSITISRPGADGRPLPSEPVLIEKEEPLVRELSNFAECVALHKTPMVSGEDGKKALELAMQVLSRMNMVKARSAKTSGLQI